ncbi:C-type lectin mannose-binding isoform-like [Ptychodera flava]|uniref:C-type lectin mannose-binding isoform-like n=1 Tax=Ptychodera flava TaxID=63121 RepID=UPI00396A0A30
MVCLKLVLSLLLCSLALYRADEFHQTADEAFDVQTGDHSFDVREDVSLDVGIAKFGRGWRCFPKNSCYFIYPEQKYSWSSAKSECNLRGGKLATIDDAMEDAYLREFARLEGNLWIGFNDILSEGNWKWDKGSIVTYTNWYNNRPFTSSSNLFDCVYMHRSYNGQWYDTTCTALYGYICEKNY